MPFPVSIKGVLIDDDRVVLLENERQEWELPGGRLEAGEDPPVCLAREISEELSAQAQVGPILDCWLYEVSPGREVVIVTYGVRRVDESPLRVSHEHKRIGMFRLDEIDSLPMPDGYRKSIRTWANRMTAVA
jgi:8-oxo-dGTP pyrophosphatase MutT (NUDIX family)